MLIKFYKTIFFVEAVVTKLDPNYNIWLSIKPWMEGWKRRNLGIKTEIKKALEKSINILINLLT
jgi:predicted unusual protein kinase regulating ubiquinone biosynthesis (AarF/ABC1/UbiB family)